MTATFPLIPRRRVLGLAFGGLHSIRRGHGSDVAASRPYRPGDAMRTIDWAASARMSLARGTDEFVVREHFADEAPRVTDLGHAPPAGPLDLPLGPHAGLNPPPNRGTNLYPAVGTNLPASTAPPRVGLIVKKRADGRWVDDNEGDWTDMVSGTNAPFTGRVTGWELLDRDVAVIDVAAIDAAYVRARSADRPCVVIARTRKGEGVSFLADKPGWHGKTLDPEQTKQALAELGDAPSRTFAVLRPEPWDRPRPATGTPALKPYTEPLATRKAYGEALAALGAVRGDVVVLDAEVSNSTHSEDFKKVAPERFFEMYIAEQQLVAAAVGMQVVGLVPFASTFAAFLTRAYDFIRMAAISQADIRLSGSHAGVSIGEDGPSQMALEDLAMMRAVHGSTVLYPCDANQTASLVAQLADRSGVSYLRTTREKTPILYPAGETFPIGGSKVVRGGGPSDRVAIVAAGITVHEAVKAADELAGDGLPVRVIDLYSLKPIDTQTLVSAHQATGGRFVVVEDHWPEGGLGDAVLAALAGSGELGLRYRHLAVRGLPGSGKPAELLDAAGISARHIAKAARELAG